jgi:cell division protease FtsH
MNRMTSWIFGAMVMLALIAVSVQLATLAAPPTQVVAFSDFEHALAQGRVESVDVTDSTLVGHLREPAGSRLVAQRVEPEVAAWLDRFGVKYAREPQGGSFMGTLASWLVPPLIFVGLWVFVLGRAGGRTGVGGFMGVGRSGAKVHVESDTGVTFADVAGVDEAKAELQEVVEFLQHPREYARLGAHMPRGVLLVGPPGTGKTMLAKAVAGQARVPFFSITGSEFVEMFVGVGAARVRDLFAQARRRAPAIVFIDELDALGRARGLREGLGGSDEKEQTLNQLLAEMDGFDTTGGLIVLAATNRPEILDPALLRAGRFDRQVLVDRPDRTGRLAILRVHAAKVRLAPSVRLEDVAALTTGFSGADLANLVNEAALRATRRQADAVTLDDFTLAIERIVAGLEKRSRLLNPRERAIVAWHEMGHALVALALDGSAAVRKVSIVPHGIGALGYTLQRPLEDRYLASRSELEARLAVLLGGRAAECLVFGERSTGAADDLARATDIALEMVTRHGMDDALGHVAYERDRASPLEAPMPAWRDRGSSSEDTLRRIDDAVRRIVSAAFERATAVLVGHREALDRGARALLERETLEENELRALASDLGATGNDGAALPDASEHVAAPAL